MQLNKNYLKQLEISSRFKNKTTMQKLLMAPMKTIHFLVLKKIIVRFKKPFRTKAKLFWGDQMTVLFPEAVSMALFYHNFYEEGLTQMILKYLKPRMTFFDVGAHFGYFTLLGSSIVGNKGQIHSFEPTPSSFKILKSNVKDKKNIYPNNVALFSKRGSLTLNDYGFKFSAFNSLYDARLNSARHMNSIRYIVPTITLDEYIFDRNITPDFIKIDAESSEYEILQGMEQILNEYRPIISIEVGDVDIEGVISSKNLLLHLIKRGYQPYEYKNGKILKHELKNRYNYDNILFLPT